MQTVTASTRLLLGSMLLGSVLSMPALADEASIKRGQEVAYDRKTGNCLACHVIADGALPGNQGPPLVAMAARFPDREVLKAQISNPLDKNPNSIMPPFGLHNIISDQDIDDIVDYLLTL